MRVIVVGGGSWGTAFALLLRRQGHDVWLATRDADQALAIGKTGRNPRYLPEVELDRVRGTTIGAAPFADAELVVLAVPSRAFAGVAAGIPGSAPILSLTKGLDPATGARLSTLVRGRGVAVLSGRTSPRRWRRGCRARPSSRARTPPSRSDCRQRSTRRSSAST